MFTSYKDMSDSIDDEKKLMDKRLELVRFSNDNGIKTAARFYKCSKNTVKLCALCIWIGHDMTDNDWNAWNYQENQSYK